MSKRVWHKGPPPHIGWWNASLIRCSTVWRWWNGKRWSWAVSEGDPAEVASLHATQYPGGSLQEAIEWTNYWPKNARVPRVKP